MKPQAAVDTDVGIEIGVMFVEEHHESVDCFGMNVN